MNILRSISRRRFWEIGKRRKPIQLANKKHEYIRECGVCGERDEQSEMIRDDGSPTGWICKICYAEEHPEDEVEEW